VFNNMTFGYVQPFSFTIASPPAIRVASVQHGLTEITLNDGRIVRATLHVNDVKISAQKPGDVDVSYNVVAEVVAIPLCQSSTCMRRFSKAARRRHRDQVSRLRRPTQPSREAR
jgi:hypothetical protein